MYSYNNMFDLLQGLLSNPLFCIIWVFTLIAQALIVQFGGLWLSTKSLTFEQWAYCFLFGILELVWGQASLNLCFLIFSLIFPVQIITTIPSSVLPKFLTVGRG